MTYACVSLPQALLCCSCHWVLLKRPSASPGSLQTAVSILWIHSMNKLRLIPKWQTYQWRKNKVAFGESLWDWYLTTLSVTAYSLKKKKRKTRQSCSPKHTGNILRNKFRLFQLPGYHTPGPLLLSMFTGALVHQQLLIYILLLFCQMKSCWDQLDLSNFQHLPVWWNHLQKARDARLPCCSGSNNSPVSKLTEHFVFRRKELLWPQQAQCPKQVEKRR